MKIKNQNCKQSHKGNGIGVGRNRTFPLSSDAASTPSFRIYVKTSLSESEVEAEG